MTRQDIEQLPANERPTIRCRIDAVYVDEDGEKEHGRRDVTGHIVVEGNNPWIEVHAAGISHAERFGWSLVLEVLNREFATPIHFSREFEYEISHRSN